MPNLIHPMKSARLRLQWLRSLARISHQLSTAELQCRALTALHLVWVLNVLQVRLRALSLRILATYRYETRWECELEIA